MRKEFSEAHKDEIIARAYGRGQVYGQIAEWLLNPNRPSQLDFSADETERQIASRLSGHREDSLTCAYVDANLKMFKNASPERAVALATMLEHGNSAIGLSAYASNWHRQLN